MRLHQRIRRPKLQGEQLDISFPRRGRPSRFRRLERAGQMRLGLTAGKYTKCTNHRITEIDQTEQNACQESPEAALDYLFPIRPLTEDELFSEFNRLFPPEA